MFPNRFVKRIFFECDPSPSPLVIFADLRAKRIRGMTVALPKSRIRAKKYSFAESTTPAFVEEKLLDIRSIYF
jgi:hypothetical protein